MISSVRGLFGCRRGAHWGDHYAWFLGKCPFPGEMCQSLRIKDLYGWTSDLGFGRSGFGVWSGPGCLMSDACQVLVRFWS